MAKKKKVPFSAKDRIARSNERLQVRIKPNREVCKKLHWTRIENSRIRPSSSSSDTEIKALRPNPRVRISSSAKSVSKPNSSSLSSKDGVHVRTTNPKHTLKVRGTKKILTDWSSSDNTYSDGTSSPEQIRLRCPGLSLNLPKRRRALRQPKRLG